MHAGVQDPGAVGSAPGSRCRGPERRDATESCIRYFTHSPLGTRPPGPGWQAGCRGPSLAPTPHFPCPLPPFNALSRRLASTAQAKGWGTASGRWWKMGAQLRPPTNTHSTRTPTS